MKQKRQNSSINFFSSSLFLKLTKNALSLSQILTDFLNLFHKLLKSVKKYLFWNLIQNKIWTRTFFLFF